MSVSQTDGDVQADLLRLIDEADAEVERQYNEIRAAIARGDWDVVAEMQPAYRVALQQRRLHYRRFAMQGAQQQAVLGDVNCELNENGVRKIELKDKELKEKDVEDMLHVQASGQPRACGMEVLNTDGHQPSQGKSYFQIFRALANWKYTKLD